MCRNIKTLYNFEPPATEEEVYLSSLQFVRKLSGFTRPSKANQAGVRPGGGQGVARRPRADRLPRHQCPAARPRDRGPEGQGEIRRAVRHVFQSGHLARFCPRFRTHRSSLVGFPIDSTRPARAPGRFRHDQRQVKSRADRLRRGLSRRTRHRRLRACPPPTGPRPICSPPSARKGRAASGCPATATACRSRASAGPRTPSPSRSATASSMAAAACDMKGFIACVLASVPLFKSRKLKEPIHLIISYDEEVGCTGVRPLIAQAGATICPGPAPSSSASRPA